MTKRMTKRLTKRMIMLNFAELDEALAALEQDLGGDPSRLGEAIAGERNEGQLSSEESEGGSDDAVPTE